MITFRTEEGLPFVSCEFMNLLLWSALARAQRLYPVKICGVTIEANHVHILLYVEDPELIPQFVKMFKQETAHYLSRLLGRKKKTTWCEGYDSPVILDSDKALQSFAYAMLNPVKDCLVNSMSEYPGVSSFNMLISGVSRKKVPLISRSSVPVLKDPSNPWLEDVEIVKKLKERNKEIVNLEIDPTCFRKAYKDFENISEKEFKKILVDTLNSWNKIFLSERKSKKAIGRQALIKASMIKDYKPRAHGKRMLCLSTFKELRQTFISIYKDLRVKAEEVYQNWKKGDFTIPFPPGMFAPSPPRYANLVFVE